MANMRVSRLGGFEIETTLTTVVFHTKKKRENVSQKFRGKLRRKLTAI